MFEENIITYGETNTIISINACMANVTKALTYTRINLQAIMKHHEHDIDTVYITSGFRLRCYKITNPVKDDSADEINRANANGLMKVRI